MERQYIHMRSRLLSIFSEVARRFSGHESSPSSSSSRARRRVVVQVTTGAAAGGRGRQRRADARRSWNSGLSWTDDDGQAGFKCQRHKGSAVGAEVDDPLVVPLLPVADRRAITVGGWRGGE